MTKSNIDLAIAGQPEPPCTGCPFFDQCAEHELACELFFDYVRSVVRPWTDDPPPTRVPTRRIYNAIMADNEHFEIRPTRGRLEDETVRQIRSSNKSIVQIANEIGLSRATVYRIKAGTSYGHVV